MMFSLSSNAGSLQAYGRPRPLIRFALSPVIYVQDTSGAGNTRSAGAASCTQHASLHLSLGCSRLRNRTTTRAMQGPNTTTQQPKPLQKPPQQVQAPNNSNPPQQGKQQQQGTHGKWRLAALEKDSDEKGPPVYTAKEQPDHVDAYGLVYSRAKTSGLNDLYACMWSHDPLNELQYRLATRGDKYSTKILTLATQKVVAHKNLVRLAAEDAPFDEREVLAMNQLAELLLPLMPRCPDIRDPVTLLYACAQGQYWHAPLLSALVAVLTRDDGKMLREQGNGFSYGNILWSIGQAALVAQEQPAAAAILQQARAPGGILDTICSMLYDPDARSHAKCGELIGIPLNHLDAAQSLHGLASMGLTAEDTPLCALLAAEAAKADFRGFDAQAFSNVVWAVAKVRLQDQAFFDTIARCLPQVMAKEGKISGRLGQNWSLVVYALAQARQWQPPVLELLAATLLTPTCAPKEFLRTMPNQPAANLIWALACFGRLDQIPDGHALVKHLTERFVATQRGITHAQDLDSQGICNTLWALLVLGQMRANIVSVRELVSLAPKALAACSHVDPTALLQLHQVFVAATCSGMQEEFLFPSELLASALPFRRKELKDATEEPATVFQASVDRALGSFAYLTKTELQTAVNNSMLQGKPLFPKEVTLQGIELLPIAERILWCRSAGADGKGVQYATGSMDKFAVVEADGWLPMHPIDALIRVTLSVEAPEAASTTTSSSSIGLQLASPPPQQQQQSVTRTLLVAVEADGPDHYLVNEPSMMHAPTVLRNRMLASAFRGLLVCVPHQEWDGHANHGSTQRTFLLRRLAVVLKTSGAMQALLDGASMPPSSHETSSSKGTSNTSVATTSTATSTVTARGSSNSAPAAEPSASSTSPISPPSAPQKTPGAVPLPTPPPKPAVLQLPPRADPFAGLPKVARGSAGSALGPSRPVLAPAGGAAAPSSPAPAFVAAQVNVLASGQMNAPAPAPAPASAPAPAPAGMSAAAAPKMQRPVTSGSDGNKGCAGGRLSPPKRQAR